MSCARSGRSLPESALLVTKSLHLSLARLSDEQLGMGQLVKKCSFQYFNTIKSYLFSHPMLCEFPAVSCPRQAQARFGA